MGGLKSYLSLISLLALFSCSKEITRQNNESVGMPYGGRGGN